MWKKNPLHNLMNHQAVINKIYLCAKDPYDAKISVFN